MINRWLYLALDYYINIKFIYFKTKLLGVNMKLSEFGAEFLRLALRIDKHIKGYVDFYIGPKYHKQVN